jgi:hypothetical protein
MQGYLSAHLIAQIFKVSGQIFLLEVLHTDSLGVAIGIHPPEVGVLASLDFSFNGHLRIGLGQRNQISTDPITACAKVYIIRGDVECKVDKTHAHTEYIYCFHHSRCI